jgi:hypothetical protein
MNAVQPRLGISDDLHYGKRLVKYIIYNTVQHGLDIDRHRNSLPAHSLLQSPV